MNFGNPTQLRIGMTGTFNGKSYRIVGRAVLGVMESGVIYGWNEFNLQADNGESATLVYEESADDGIQWRWFEMFDPKDGISAEELPTIRHGFSVVVDGQTYFVTEANHSRVYHVEGIPPEGEQSGSLADYFNAQALDKLLVASWTGKEVEYYRGRNLTARIIAAAFNLRGSELVKFHLARGGSFLAAPNQKALFLIACIFGFFALITFGVPQHRPPAVVNYTAPASPLAVGAAGRLDGVNYTVFSHEVVEREEVGLDVHYHEFDLRDESGNTALLIFGSTPKAKDWLLFTPIVPDHPLTPEQAGNRRFGQNLQLDDKKAHITELFRQQTISREDLLNASATLKSGTSYGLIARAGPDVYLVRWDATTIHFYLGHQIQPNEMKTAFPSLATN